MKREGTASSRLLGRRIARRVKRAESAAARGETPRAAIARLAYYARIRRGKS